MGIFRSGTVGVVSLLTFVAFFGPTPAAADELPITNLTTEYLGDDQVQFSMRFDEAYGESNESIIIGAENVPTPNLNMYSSHWNLIHATIETEGWNNLNAGWGFLPSGLFVIRRDTPIEAGEQVTFVLGNIPHDDFPDGEDLDTCTRWAIAGPTLDWEVDQVYEGGEYDANTNCFMEGLNAVSDNNGSSDITVTFPVQDTEPDLYRIIYSTSGSSQNTEVEPDSEATLIETFTVTDTEPETEYSVRVNALEDIGDGEYRVIASSSARTVTTGAGNGSNDEVEDVSEITPIPSVTKERKKCTIKKRGKGDMRITWKKGDVPSGKTLAHHRVIVKQEARNGKYNKVKNIKRGKKKRGVRLRGYYLKPGKRYRAIVKQRYTDGTLSGGTRVQFRCKQQNPPSTVTLSSVQAVRVDDTPERRRIYDLTWDRPSDWKIIKKYEIRVVTSGNTVEEYAKKWDIKNTEKQGTAIIPELEGEAFMIWIRPYYNRTLQGPWTAQGWF